MRTPERWAVAVRRPDGSIHTEAHDVAERWPRLRGTVLRGPAALAESLAVGSQALRVFLRETTGVEPTVGQLGLTFGAFGIAVLAIFVVGPGVIASAPAPTLWAGVSRDLLETGLRVAVLLAYLGAVSRSESARSLFAYHGAEHKVVAAFERHGRSPSASEACGESPVHMRCGTNFVAIFVLCCAVVYDFVPQGSVGVAIAGRIVGLPIVVALAYETMRAAAGRAGSRWARAVSWPGRMLQRLTTREPSDDKLAVAVAAFEALET
jgi:uncharacterized protein YqhQ